MPNISGIPTACEKVILEDLVGLKNSNLTHLEFDIQRALETLALYSVFLEGESEQKAGISAYVASFMHSDLRMRKWLVEYTRQWIIDTLSKGMGCKISHSCH